MTLVPSYKCIELADRTATRICPGREFAEASLFILCASILHTFDIRAPVDVDGVPVQLEHDMSTTNTVS